MANLVQLAGTSYRIVVCSAIVGSDRRVHHLNIGGCLHGWSATPVVAACIIQLDIAPGRRLPGQVKCAVVRARDGRVVGLALKSCMCGLAHHRTCLPLLVKDSTLFNELAADRRQVGMAGRERHADLCRQAHTRPGFHRRYDIEALKAALFPESNILDINKSVGYFASLDHLADGLSVPLKDFMEQREGEH